MRKKILYLVLTITIISGISINADVKNKIDNIYYILPFFNSQDGSFNNSQSNEIIQKIELILGNPQNYKFVKIWQLEDYISKNKILLSSNNIAQTILNYSKDNSLNNIVIGSYSIISNKVAINVIFVDVNKSQIQKDLSFKVIGDFDSIKEIEDRVGIKLLSYINNKQAEYYLSEGKNRDLIMANNYYGTFVQSGYENSLNLFKNMLNDKQDNPKVYSGISKCYIRLAAIQNGTDNLIREHYLSLAYNYSVKSLLLDNNNPDGYLSLALLYKERGRQNLCYENAKKALQISPDDLESLITLGDSFSSYYFNDTNDNNKALEVYDQIIKKNINCYLVYSNKGFVLKALGRYDEAIVAFQTALKLNPDDFISYNNLGGVYYQMGQFCNAVDNFSKALQIQPNNVFIIINLANAFEFKGELDKSMSLWNTVLNSLCEQKYKDLAKKKIESTKQKH